MSFAAVPPSRFARREMSRGNLGKFSLELPCYPCYGPSRDPRLQRFLKQAVDWSEAPRGDPEEMTCVHTYADPPRPCALDLGASSRPACYNLYLLNADKFQRLHSAHWH